MAIDFPKLVQGQDGLLDPCLSWLEVFWCCCVLAVFVYCSNSLDLVDFRNIASRLNRSQNPDGNLGDF
jgi:hypothetical protein